jgi:hypothetical protein
VAGGARSPDETRLAVPGPWQVTFEDGTPAPVDGPGDWTRAPELERFAGRLRYRTVVEVDPASAPDAAAPDGAPVAATLDLGEVGEAAEVRVNGVPAGAALWAPYVLPGGGRWQAGENVLEVLVTPSAANHYEGAQRPAGLIGPVTLVLRRRPGGARTPTG